MSSSKLAVAGGPKVMKSPWVQKWPLYGETEKKNLQDVLDSDMWSQYPSKKDSGVPQDKITHFENQFTEYIGARHGISVANGTSALEVACRAIGTNPGDEIITPAYSFIASATCCYAANAVPVFVEVEPEALRLDPDKVEAAITGRTRAIIAVHLDGYPCDMDRLMDIAARHNLIVIEDCARAHGTEWKGKKTGSIGHFGGYSFWTSKLMTAGEGGFLTVNDDSLFHRAWSVANQGRQIGGEFYEHSVLGCNERMSQFTAAILLGQLERLPGQIATRETNMQYLESLLAGVPGLRPAKREPRETTLTYFFATLHYDPAAFGGLSIDMFQRAMTAEGIPIRQGPNSPLSRNPIFAADALRANGVGHLYEARGGMIDYHALRFPVVENSLTVQMQHRTLLGPREQMEAVAEAAQKIRDNVGELLELAAKE